MGDLSSHFNRAEFRCKGHGKAGHTPHPTVVDPELVERLERLRTINGGLPLRIESGHRCAWWNSRVGGAARSQHLLGRAADVAVGVYTVEEAERAGFHGLGVVGQWVRHVDVRSTPARWEY